MVGAATEWSVIHLPFSLLPLSNTAAPWVVLAFAVALSARWTGEAVVLSVVCLIALVLGFYLAQSIRGWAVSRLQVVFWSATSLLAGPVIGVAAGWLRHGGRLEGALGAGVLGGVLVGEALHGRRDLQFSSPARYWEVQLVVGIGLTVGLASWRCLGRWASSVPTLAASGAACAVTALGTLIAYQVP